MVWTEGRHSARTPAHLAIDMYCRISEVVVHECQQLAKPGVADLDEVVGGHLFMAKDVALVL